MRGEQSATTHHRISGKNFKKELANLGIPVKIDDVHAIAHNKIVIIDGETIITGSFNFTKSTEENNAENLLVIHNRKLAERYIKNWLDHERHSEVYAGRGGNRARLSSRNFSFPMV
jgi:phosphatidylserine/phosphatidylglycerophosphate/cardiolipin synthase-like enzyme